jgi:hypothetical protein
LSLLSCLFLCLRLFSSFSSLLYFPFGPFLFLCLLHLSVFFFPHFLSLNLPFFVYFCLCFLHSDLFPIVLCSFPACFPILSFCILHVSFSF